MKKLFCLILLVTVQYTFTQSSATAKKLLDEVSEKMGAYKNMQIGFSTSLANKEAGISEGDEPPINGKITLQGEKYYLEYLGNILLFDGNRLYVINKDEKEVSINQGDLSEENGFIYPSKMLTFYKEGYNLKMGKKETINGKSIQFVNLTPIDSNSEIIKVTLGIDAVTKHIYQMIQTGANGAITTLSITNFKSNQDLSSTLFSFNRKKYEDLNYFID